MFQVINNLKRHEVLYKIWMGISGFAVLSAIFYFDAYFSVTQYMPDSIPVHHDDYSNYSMGAEAFQWSWNRPFSTYVIHLLGLAGPAWLSAAIRILSVLFVLFSWVLLCQVIKPKMYWLMLFAFGAAIFSTPVIVEYARYTGMITHLLSGCLGLASVIALFRSADECHQLRSGRWWLLLSVLLLVLSSLAKEDFILFYALSLVYTVMRWPLQQRRLITVAGLGLLLCVALIAASKLLALSSFLGVVDPLSPYYVNTTPVSIINTVGLYLLGANHPAMHLHGRLVAFIFVAVTLATICVSFHKRRFYHTAYFILASLTLIAPYSVLPNHVNAYYELVWLPMVIAAAASANTEIFQQVSNSSAWRYRAPALALLLVATIFSISDYPMRKSIAQWYDARTQSNLRLFSILQLNRLSINASRVVCITGADAFSPWFMHDAKYLNGVMNLHSTWVILSNPTSSEYSGFVASAAYSSGRVRVVKSPNEFLNDCLRIDLKEQS